MISGVAALALAALAGFEAAGQQGRAPLEARQTVAVPASYVVPVGRDLAVLNWRLSTFEGRAPTRFRGTENGEIEVVTRSSMAVLSRPIQVDLRMTPCLQWRWRVDETTIPAVNLSHRGEDDRPLMVSVGFPFQPDHASVWERIKHTVLRQVSGRDVPGRVLAYVWGGSGRRGDLVESPQLETAGLMRILRSGDTALGIWHAESVDIAAEFTARFNHRPPPLVEIAVLGDSDDTMTHSTGLIADLRFSPSCSDEWPARRGAAP